MAIVGSANIIVRAITNGVNDDIRRGFKGTDRVGRDAGTSLGKSFSSGFNKNTNTNVFNRITNGLRAMVPQAEAARKTFSSLNRAAQFLGTGLSVLVAGIFSLGGALVGLAGSAGGAIAALAGIGNAVFALIAAFSVVKLALGGVSKAVKALNKPKGGGGGGSSGGGGKSGAAAERARLAAIEAIDNAEKNLARTIESNREALLDANNSVRDAQLSLNQAIKEGREEIQQLGFDAEDAALSERKASLDLEKARIALARAQDLPPNSRARQEAELAYQEAELNLRKAKDRSADLNKEQDRLAKTGVRGTAGVISATDALAQAEANRAKTVRDALRSEADANEALAKAKKKSSDVDDGGGGGGGGGSDPFEGLNDAQIKFAKFIASLKPKFDELSRIASESFLPKLQTAIETLMGAPYDAVAVGVGIVGSALGDASIEIANAIASASNIAKLTTLFESSGRIIISIGGIMAELYGSLLSILTAAAPGTEKFFNFLESKLDQFNTYLDSTEGNKALVNFFDLATDAAAQWGRIFGNIFAAIGGVIQANLGPGSGGQILLDFLEKGTQGWDDLNSTVESKSALRDFFIGVAKNTTSILSALGKLGGVLKEVSVDPNIGKTFDNLAAGAPALKTILSAFISAGPSIGTLFANITEVIALLVQGETSGTFFDTLNTVVVGIRDFLKGDFVSAVLDASAPFQGILMAIGLIGSTLLIGGKIVVGYGTLFASTIGTIVGGFGKLGGAFAGVANGGGLGKGLANIGTSFDKTGTQKDAFIKNLGLYDKAAVTSVAKTGGIRGALNTLGGGFKSAAVATGGFVSGALRTLAGGFATAGKAALAFALGPVGIIIGVIALLVGLFILLYNTNDEFRVAMDAVWAELSATFAQAGADIMEALQPLIPVFMDLISTLIDSLLPVVFILIDAFSQILTAVLPLIPLLIGALVPALVAIISAVVPLVTMLITTLVPIFAKIIGAIVPLIILIIEALVPVFVTIIEAIAPLITLLVTGLVPVIEFLAAVLGFVIPVIVAVIAIIIDGLVAAITFLIDWVVSFVENWSTNWNAVGAVLSTIWDYIVLVIQTGIQIVSNVITTVIKFISDTWTNVWNGISTFFSIIWQAIVLVVTTYINIVVTVISTVVKFIVDLWTATWTGISTFFSKIWNGIASFFLGVVNTVKGYVNNFVAGFQLIMDFLPRIGNTFRNVFNGIADFMRGVVNTILSIVEGMVNGVIGAINGIIGGINGAVGAVGSALGINLSVPTLPRVSLPRLADGGTVFPSAGGSIVNVAEAGRPERIEPLDDNGLSKRDKAMIDYLAGAGGGAGVNISVTQLPNEDGQELAERISRILSFNMRKGSLV